MNDRVSVEVKEGVADVRLVRTDKMNAIDEAMFSALIAAGERLKADRSVRAVVLSGDGRAFCAGLDMGRFRDMERGAERGGERLGGERTPGGANPSQQAVMVWREMPAPVIAAVHGVAFGGGLQLALGADLRFVAADARLSVLEIKWGLVPDMGGIALLRGLLRDDVARELTWSGRIVSGDEALALGLATRVCADPRAEALVFAAEIAARSPDAIRAGKRLFNAAFDASQHDLLLAESLAQTALIGGPNQVEAVTAALENRAPRFAD
ncbi:crotonase/enoyl-CoA hydratase family protein [Phenylobacterium sp.]|jgi:enoyl-CoA hydratase/carnithine racemase|uniref:crotonase/enoyl-CoA hydratase family protein n=1 Tax=Phenylobacterium sp. TaxID=1871053 RepID=UPI002F403C4A